jgi:hypothetical protein
MATMIPYSARPLVMLRRKALIRTALSGSPFWRGIAITILAGRFARRQTRKQPETLTVDKVLIGQTLSVATLAAVSRKEKRRARKADKAAGTSS